MNDPIQVEFRFVGGPWHGERHAVHGMILVSVPIKDRLPTAVVDPPDDAVGAYVGVNCAVYERSGDYEAEWFYRFKGTERR